MAKYEIELRGILTLNGKNKILKFLRKNGKFIKKYERIQWVFSESWKKKLDLRIKKTNKSYEFSLKLGNPSKSNRKEISVPIPLGKDKSAFDFLKHLGYRTGFKAWRNAQIYEYKGIEWAIVEVPNHSWYFEAEKLVNNKKDGKVAEAEISKVCNQLELIIYTPKQTIDFITKLDREANKTFKL